MRWSVMAASVLVVGGFVGCAGSTNTVTVPGAEPSNGLGDRASSGSSIDDSLESPDARDPAESGADVTLPSVPEMPQPTVIDPSQLPELPLELEGPTLPEVEDLLPMGSAASMIESSHSELMNSYPIDPSSPAGALCWAMGYVVNREMLVRVVGAAEILAEEYGVPLDEMRSHLGVEMSYDEANRQFTNEMAWLAGSEVPTVALSADLPDVVRPFAEALFAEVATASTQGYRPEAMTYLGELSSSDAFSMALLEDPGCLYLQ